MREQLQAGAELIGSPSPGGTVEVLTLLTRALEATGLEGFRIGVGDASLYPALLADAGVPDERRPALLERLVRRDFVGLEHAAEGLDQRVVTLPQLRGGPAVLDALPGGAGLRAVHAALEADVAARVIFDLGLVRDFDYYTGAVFEVYDASIGTPIGGGGRYDELMGRLGRPLPAVGFSLEMSKLHEALAAEERAR